VEVAFVLEEEEETYLFKTHVGLKNETITYTNKK